MSMIEMLPNGRSALAWDFKASKRIIPNLQLTRAGPAYVHAGEGLVKEIPANTPRLEVVGGVCKGILIEGAQTNQLKNSSLVDGGNWTQSSSGTTSTVNLNQPSPIDGCVATRFNTIALAEGEAATSRGYIQYFPAEAGKEYTYSVYVKKDPSSLDCHIRLRAAYSRASDNVSVFLTDIWHSFTDHGTDAKKGNEYIGNGWWRVWLTFTAPTDITNLHYGVWIANEQREYLFTNGGHSVLIAGPQAEISSVPTSFIRSGLDATATRAADVALIDVERFISDGGFSVAYSAKSNYGSNYQLFFGDNISTVNNYVGVRINSAGAYINSIEGGRTVAVPQPSERAQLTVAATFSNNYTAGYVNGSYMAPHSSSYAAANWKARKWMKLSQITDQSIGWCQIEKLYIWPRVFSKDELMALEAAL